MKNIFLSSAVLFSILIGASSCLANAIVEARADMTKISSETNQLVGSCNFVTPPANTIKHQLANLAADLNSFAPALYVEDALENIRLGMNAVDVSLFECTSYHGQDFSYGKELLDLYLNNIDIDLMLAEHGLGTNGKAKR